MFLSRRKQNKNGLMEREKALETGRDTAYGYILWAKNRLWA